MKRKQVETRIYYDEDNFIVKLYSYKNYTKMQGENFETKFMLSVNEVKNILWKTEKDNFAIAFQIAMILEERIHSYGFQINGNVALHAVNTIASVVEANNITF